MDIQNNLKKYFGFDTFRPGQREIIEAVLDGFNAIAVLPTGAGKSLCYQLPALMTKNFSIVISPLISLMKDQVDSLNGEKDLAAFINSSMDYREEETVLREIYYGNIKLLYLSPEKLGNIQLAEKLKNLSPSFLFVDEAHCISEWGHNFRPSYTKIKDFIEYLGLKKVSAFTATATPEVISDIIKQLNVKKPRTFVRGFERDNLFLNVEITKSKKNKVYELLNRFGTPAIIYTSSRKRAEEVTEFLVLKKIKSEFYHAGLPPEYRRRIQDDFISGKLPIIAATNAFGMGIDKKDIRLIIHYNTPGSIENYYQEIGRAGRDGKESHTFLLHDDSDINIHNYFLSISYPTKETIQKIYNSICDLAQIAVGNYSDKEIPVNIDYIKTHTGLDLSNGLIHSSLKYLEEAKYLVILSEYESDISIKFLVDKSRLQKIIKSSKNELIKDLTLSLLKKFGSKLLSSRNKFSLNKLSGEFNYSQQELITALRTMEESGLIEFTTFDSRDLVKLSSPRVKSDELKLNYKLINERYLFGQKKLDKMVNFVFAKDCRFKFILKYFGEDADSFRCGKCDNCLKQTGYDDSNLEYVKEIALQTLSAIDEELLEKDLINILLGTSTETKLTRVRTFSSLKNYKADAIKSSLNSLVDENKLERSEGRLKKYKIKSKLQEVTLSEEDNPINFDAGIDLYHKLRAIRKSTASKFLQSQELICPDSVLAEISRVRPKTKFELLAVKGLNQRMFNKFGNDILEVINSEVADEKNGPQKKSLPANVQETYRLLLKKHTLDEIASLRKLDSAVVSMQIETIIEFHPDVDISKVLSGDILNRIKEEFESGLTELKELKNRIGDNVNYPQIRIAIAKLKALQNI